MLFGREGGATFFRDGIPLNQKCFLYFTSHLSLRNGSFCVHNFKSTVKFWRQS